MHVEILYICFTCPKEIPIAITSDIQRPPQNYMILCFYSSWFILFWDKGCHNPMRIFDYIFQWFTHSFVPNLIAIRIFKGKDSCWGSLFHMFCLISV